EYVSKSQLANGVRPYQTARQDLRLGAITNPTAFAPALSTTPPTGFLPTTPAQGTSGPFGVAVPYPSAGGNFQNFNCPIATERNTNASTSYLYPYTSSTGVVNNLTNLNGVCDENGFGSWLPSENRNTLFMSFKQQLSDAVSVSANFDYSTRFEGSIPAANNSGGRGTISNVTVFGPASAAANVTQRNPFYTTGSTGLSQSAMQVSYNFTQLLAGQPLPEEKTGDTVAFTNLGLDWDLGGEWLFSMGGTFGVDYDFDRTTNALCAACANL